MGLRQQLEMAPTRKITPDSNLSWDQISIAKNILLESYRHALWPEDHICMWSAFYANLEAYNLYQEEYGNCLLIRYHADTR